MLRKILGFPLVVVGAIAIAILLLASWIHEEVTGRALWELER